MLILKEEMLDRNRCRIGTCARLNHLIEVLRVKPGDTVNVSLLYGPVGEGLIERVDSSSVELHCTWSETPAPPRHDLLLALPRPKVMKRLWFQLAVMGVRRVYLTNAEKVERMYFDSHVLDKHFYEDRMREGLQLSGDTFMPRISIHKRLKVLLEDELGGVDAARTRVLLDHRANARMADVVREREVGPLLMAIGPEGGWTAYERSLFGQHHFIEVKMSSRILKSDLASLSALVLANEFLP